MKNQLGKNIRKIRELKGFSQQYMAQQLSISQRTYSKLEREEIKLDWNRINQISETLEIEPVDLISFDDNLIFTNCNQSEKINTNNNFPAELRELYENRIAGLTEEVAFLRKLLLNQQNDI